MHDWLNEGADPDEIEEPTVEDVEDLTYRKLLMVAWMAAGGLCGCGKSISFEDAYQYGECLECLHKDAAENIEY